MITVERSDFVSVPVTDLERSTRFYAETLGLEQIGQTFQGPHTAPIALRVPNVGEARQALEAKGVEFAGETFDTGVCHMAHFQDPDGNTLMLHRRYAPHEG